MSQWCLKIVLRRFARFRCRLIGLVTGRLFGGVRKCSKVLRGAWRCLEVLEGVQKCSEVLVGARRRSQLRRAEELRELLTARTITERAL